MTRCPSAGISSRDSPCLPWLMSAAPIVPLHQPGLLFDEDRLPYTPEVEHRFITPRCSQHMDMTFALCLQVISNQAFSPRSMR